MAVIWAFNRMFSASKSLRQLTRSPPLGVDDSRDAQSAAKAGDADHTVAQTRQVRVISLRILDNPPVADLDRTVQARYGRAQLQLLQCTQQQVRRTDRPAIAPKRL